MKKTNLLLSALVCGTTMLSPMAMFASEVTGPTTQATTEQKVQAMEIKKTVNSSYTVTIPQNVTLASSDTQKAYVVNAKGNIAPNETVTVTVANGTVAMNRAGDTAYTTSGKKSTVTLEQASWKGDALLATGGSGANVNGLVKFDETKAGVYTGTVNFNVDFTVAK